MEKIKYYNSSAWKYTRKLVLDKNPYCLNCLAFGRQEKASEVHHVQKFYEQYDDDLRFVLLTDTENCIPLCKACHKQIHSSKRKLMQPRFQQYIFELKNYLCKKYLNLGKILVWTE